MQTYRSHHSLGTCSVAWNSAMSCYDIAASVMAIHQAFMGASTATLARQVLGINTAQVRHNSFSLGDVD